MLAGLAVVVGSYGAFRYRLHSLTERQRHLEAEVATRTAELQSANASLAIQVTERSRAEETARITRDKLDRQLALEHELLTAGDMDALFDRILAGVAEVVDYLTAAIIMPDGDVLALRALRSTYLRPPLQTTRLDPG